MPVPTSQREPNLSASEPVRGASAMISNVIGRKAAPACTGEKPSTFCMYSET